MLGVGLAAGVERTAAIGGTDDASGIAAADAGVATGALLGLRAGAIPAVRLRGLLAVLAGLAERGGGRVAVSLVLLGVSAELFEFLLRLFALLGRPLFELIDQVLNGLGCSRTRIVLAAGV